MAPAVGVDITFESSDDAEAGPDCTTAGDSLTGFEVPNEKPLGDPKDTGTTNGDDDDDDDDVDDDVVVNGTPLSALPPEN